MSGPDAPQTPSSGTRRSKPSGGRKGGRSVLAKENRRLIVGVVVGAVVAVFAVLNRAQVDVNWIFGTWETPLILVIAVSFLLGAVVGWVASVARRRGS